MPPTSPLPAHPAAVPRPLIAELLEPRLLLDATPLGPAFALDAPDLPDFYHSRPVIAADSRGNFVAAWERHFNDYGDGRSQWDVVARLFDSANNPRGPEFIVAGGPGDQITPAVAMDDDGDFVIAWVNYPRGIGRIPQPTIHVRRYTSAGVPQGSELLPSSGATEGEISPSVAMNAAGDVVVAWNAGFYAAGTYYSTFAQKIDRFGVARAPVQVNAPGAHSTQKYTAVGIDADGDFAVSWSNYAQAGILLARRFNASSQPREDPQVVSDGRDDLGWITQREIAMDDDGDYVVAWTGYDSGKVHFRRFDEASGAWAEPVLVEQMSPPRSGIRQEVDMDSDGEFVITWDTRSGTSSEIRARAYARDGSPRGDEFVVASEDSSGLVLEPAVALDEDGDLLVAFGSYDYGSSYDSPDNRLQIYARRYAGATEPGVPHVTGAFVGSSRWSSRTASQLQAQGLGDRSYGFDISGGDIAGGGPAAGPLPWANLDRITLTFNRAIALEPDDVIVRGGGGAAYPLATFASDRASRSATLTLARTPRADRLTVELDTAAGLSFRAPFAVLAGDGNRDARVNALDLARARSLLGKEIGYESTPPDALLYDADGSGRIDVRDVLAVRRNIGNSLAPAAAPLPITRSAWLGEESTRAALLATPSDLT